MIQRNVLLNTIEKVKGFSAIVQNFDYDMDLSTGRYVIDAKSIMGIFSLNLFNVLTLTIHAEKADDLLEAIKEYIV